MFLKCTSYHPDHSCVLSFKKNNFWDEDCRDVVWAARNSALVQEWAEGESNRRLPAERLVRWVTVFQSWPRLINVTVLTKVTWLRRNAVKSLKLVSMWKKKCIWKHCWFFLINGQNEKFKAMEVNRAEERTEGLKRWPQQIYSVTRSAMWETITRSV